MEQHQKPRTKPTRRRDAEVTPELEQQAAAPEQVDKQFVVIEGLPVEVHDLMDAMKGRLVQAQLSPQEIRVIETSHNRANAPIQRAVLRKTAAVQALALRAVNGELSPSEMARLHMALNKDLHFSDTTNDLASLIPLSAASKDLLDESINEAQPNALVSRRIDGTSSLKLEAYQELDPALYAELTKLLGVPDAEALPVVLLERAFYDQEVDSDEYMQVAEHDANPPRPFLLGGPAEMASVVGFNVSTLGLAAGAIGTLAAAPWGLPLLAVTGATWGTSIGHLLSSDAGLWTPVEAWNIRANNKRFFRLTEKEYSKAVDALRQRVDTLKASAVGRLRLFFLRELLGQSMGTLDKDEALLDKIRDFEASLDASPELEGHLETFDRFQGALEGHDRQAFNDYVEGFELYMQSDAA